MLGGWNPPKRNISNNQYGGQADPQDGEWGGHQMGGLGVLSPCDSVGSSPDPDCPRDWRGNVIGRGGNAIGPR